MKQNTLLCLLLLTIGSLAAKAKNPIPPISAQKDTLRLENIFPFQQQHCHGSTIVELPNHDLLCAWFQGSGERTSDDVAIKGARYNHQTHQWSTPFILADTPGFPDINPVLFVDSKSQLWLTWYSVLAYQWSTSLLKFRISDNYQQKTGAPVWRWQDVIQVKADGTPTTGIGEQDPFVKTLVRKFEATNIYFKKEISAIQTTQIFPERTGKKRENSTWNWPKAPIWLVTGQS